MLGKFMYYGVNPIALGDAFLPISKESKTRPCSIMQALRALSRFEGSYGY